MIPPKHVTPTSFDEPLTVEAIEKTQAGFPYLSTNCPHCGRPVNVNKEGRFGCPCGTWLKVVTKAEPIKEPDNVE